MQRLSRDPPAKFSSFVDHDIQLFALASWVPEDPTLLSLKLSPSVEDLRLNLSRKPGLRVNRPAFSCCFKDDGGWI